MCIIFVSSCVCVHVCVCVCMLSHVQLFATPCTVAHQAPLSMEFSRQEYWSGLPFPTPRDLPDPGIKPLSPAFPALAGRFFTASATWEVPHIFIVLHKIFSSVQFSSLVVSDSLRPHGPQHARLPCPSPSPGAYSNSCPRKAYERRDQPSHPLSTPSPPAFNLSQHPDLF